MNNKIILVDDLDNIFEVDESEVEINPQLILPVEILKPSKKNVNNYSEFYEGDLQDKNNY